MAQKIILELEAFDCMMISSCLIAMLTSPSATEHLKQVVENYNEELSKKITVEQREATYSELGKRLSVLRTD